MMLIKRIEQKRNDLEQEITNLKQEKVSFKNNEKIDEIQKKLSLLESFSQFEVDDYVVSYQENEKIGQITHLDLSPGGYPEVWISWNDECPCPEHGLEWLLKLPNDWDGGWKKGQLVHTSDGFGRIRQFRFNEITDNLSAFVFVYQLQEVRDYSFKYLTSAESLIKIDKEFFNLIPGLNQEERSLLENNIIEFGVREPLVVWKDYNILLDGHNRHEICLKNGIDYELIEIELPTREDARLWIMRNQLGRRNLTSEFLSYFRGKLHQASKQKRGRKPLEKNKHQSDANKNNELIEKNKHQSDANKNNELIEKNKHQSDANKTATKLAEQLKVSQATIERDARYAKAVDEIVSIMGEEIRPQILSKSTTRGYYLSKKKTIELGKLAKMKPEEVIDFFEPDVVKRLENEHERRRFEFNFKVNEVVLIKPKDNTEIKHCKGYWGIIININELKFCDLKMWNQTLLEVSPQNFVSLNLSDDECRQMNEICDRLLLLREKHNDALTYNIFQFFAHLKNPHLSEFQKQMLDFLE